MEKVIVSIIGVALIAVIVWWFFGKHDTKQTEATASGDKQHIDITVDGGYTPQTVILKQGTPATLTFLRKDPSSCLSHVVFPDFGVDAELPVGQKHDVVIDTSKTGEFEYACGMNMFHGKVIVK